DVGCELRLVSQTTRKAYLGRQKPGNLRNLPSTAHFEANVWQPAFSVHEMEQSGISGTLLIMWAFVVETLTRGACRLHIGVRKAA
ncbi:MAG: hypothetical protein WBX18_03440, partial [Terracidiphilus sp.]